jgi:hypothetical protein
MAEFSEQLPSNGRSRKEASMLDKIGIISAPLLIAATVILHTAAQAQETAWQVSKSSGDVTVAGAGGTHSPLDSGAMLKPGDTIHTGQNGRVLLVRGNETILVSPGSAVGLPAEVKSKTRTTIQLQTGSILLDVEKRDSKHFEVETPYLAAIVKGTQFRVTIDPSDSRVDVFKGQVEVMDFKSGQYALVHPSQAARIALQGPPGLSLSGAGTLSPVQQGTPRRSSIAPLPSQRSGALVNEGPPPVEASPSGIATQESTPAIAPSSPPARIAQSTGESTPPPSRSTAAREGKWTDGFAAVAQAVFNVDGSRSRKDNVVASLSLSLAIGGMVAVAVASRRGRQKAKKQ